MLQVEVAAEEKVGIRGMRRGVGEVEEGGRALLRRCIQRCDRKAERVRIGALRHVDLQVPPLNSFTYLEDNPRVGNKKGDSTLRSAPRTASRR